MIVFRCDAGPKIGMGHLFRCRTLATALCERGIQTIMIGPSKKYMMSEDEKIFNKWIPCSSWPGAENDAKRVLEVASKSSAHMAVLDDYRIDEHYQQLIKRAGLKWLQFDGKATLPLWANFIHNSNPGAKVDQYNSLIRSRNSKLLLGPKFALLRSSFSHNHSRNDDSGIKRVLVTFGGGDDRGAVLFVLKTLSKIVTNEVRFSVMTGIGNPRNKEIASWINSNGQGKIEHLINPKEVCALIRSCHLAVIAGGTTTYEVNCCEIPMLLITIADNQISQAQAWEELKCAKYLGMMDEIEPDQLITSFNYLVQQSKQKKKRNLPRIVDGLGTQRVVDEMLSIL